MKKNRNPLLEIIERKKKLQSEKDLLMMGCKPSELSTTEQLTFNLKKLVIETQIEELDNLFKLLK